VSVDRVAVESFTTVSRKAADATSEEST